MPRSPTVLSSWAQVIVDALDDRGHDSDELLRGLGLHRSALRAPGTRQSLHATRTLWHAAIEKFADPACGIMVSSHVRPTTFHALSYAIYASSTLREALHRMLRYGHIVSDAHNFRVEETASRLRLVILPRSERDQAHEQHLTPIGPETIDAMMSLVLRMCRFLAGRELSPLLVEQRRSPPEDVAPYQTFFRCPLRFEARDDALTFPTQCLDRPLVTGNPVLARHNDALLDQHLDQLNAGQLRDKVRKVLDSWTGVIAAAEIARFLGLSERSLQRRLKAEGTTYAQLVAESRAELACEYLREAQGSIDDVALRLGFHSSSTFARAFRRWVQVSPSAFRERLNVAELALGQGSVAPFRSPHRELRSK